MVDRRVVLVGLAATALIPSALLGYSRRIFSRELLDEVWRLTKGKTPQQMHAVLTQTFGAFPLWFVDDVGEVVILGVGAYPTMEDWELAGLTPQGYMQCDARVIRMCNAQGVWEERDTVERPLRHGWLVA
jgi:hypothetical protein